jgi:hypothetical protein
MVDFIINAVENIGAVFMPLVWCPCIAIPGNKLMECKSCRAD